MSNIHQPTDSNGQKTELSPLHLIRFYTIAIAIAWTAWGPLLLHQLDMLQLPVPFGIALFVGQTLGAFSPLLSLFALQRLDQQQALVKQVFEQFRYKALPVVWYIVPALTPIVITILITAAFQGLSGMPVTLLRPEPISELGWALLVVVPIQFVLGMIGSPLGEEPGWRGYVLHGFDLRGKAWTGSVIVALFWGIWHLPLFMILEVELTVITLLALASHSFIIDSFYLLSNRNLLVAMLCHQGVNTSFLFFVSSAETTAGAIALGVLAVAARITAQRMAPQVEPVAE